MSRRDRPHVVVDIRENYLCSYARPGGYKYSSVTAYPLPAKYNIHRMSLFINNTHIGTVFAPFSSSITWNDLSASECYTTSSGASINLLAIGFGTTPAVNINGTQIGGNKGTPPGGSGSTTEVGGVLPTGIPKVYYYDYNGNLRYIAHVQPT